MKIFLIILSILILVNLALCKCGNQSDPNDYYCDQSPIRGLTPPCLSNGPTLKFHFFGYEFTTDKPRWNTWAANFVSDLNIQINSGGSTNNWYSVFDEYLTGLAVTDYGTHFYQNKTNVNCNNLQPNITSEPDNTLNVYLYAPSVIPSNYNNNTECGQAGGYGVYITTSAPKFWIYFFLAGVVVTSVDSTKGDTWETWMTYILSHEVSHHIISPCGTGFHMTCPQCNPDDIDILELPDNCYNTPVPRIKILPANRTIVLSSMYSYVELACIIISHSSKTAGSFRSAIAQPINCLCKNSPSLVAASPESHLISVLKPITMVPTETIVVYTN